MIKPSSSSVACRFPNLLDYNEEIVSCAPIPAPAHRLANTSAHVEEEMNEEVEEEEKCCDEGKRGKGLKRRRRTDNYSVIEIEERNEADGIRDQETMVQ